MKILLVFAFVLSLVSCQNRNEDFNGENVYKNDFTAHQLEIEATAKIPAYAKSLLSALVLSVLGQKAVGLIGLLEGPNLTVADRTTLSDGIIRIRNVLAGTVGLTGLDKLAFIRGLIDGLTRSLAVFRGDMTAQVANQYGPIGIHPVGQQGTDPQLQMSAMPELAALIGLAGIGQNTA